MKRYLNERGIGKGGKEYQGAMGIGKMAYISRGEKDAPLFGGANIPPSAKDTANGNQGNVTPAGRYTPVQTYL